MVQYEPEIIYQFAERLYSKATTIVAVYAVAGAVIGIFIGYGMKGWTSAIIGGVILGGVGWYLGTEKAFALKLQAQTALCQAAIERNSRK